jgi:hypothetical protein
MWQFPPGIVICVPYSGSAGLVGGGGGEDMIGRHCEDLCVVATLQASLEHLEVEFCKSEKIARFLQASGFDTFLDFQYSTSKCSKAAYKVSGHFLARHSKNLCVDETGRVTLHARAGIHSRQKSRV